MKYSLSAQSAAGAEISSGHLTARSALDGLAVLQRDGAQQILIFDFKTGRLVDRATLERAEREAELSAARPMAAGR